MGQQSDYGGVKPPRIGQSRVCVGGSVVLRSSPDPIGWLDHGEASDWLVQTLSGWRAGLRSTSAFIGWLDHSVAPGVLPCLVLLQQPQLHIHLISKSDS